MDSLRAELAAAEADVKRATARLAEARRRIASSGGSSRGTIYWDVSDGSFASLATSALEVAFPGKQFSRWSTLTPRLGEQDVLFGFIFLLGRLDTRDEDLTADWAKTDRSVVIVARGPSVGKGRQDWIRPPDFPGIRQQMIHLYASLGGKRVITEADFYTDYGMSGVVNVWERDSLPRLVEFMKQQA